MYVCIIHRFSEVKYLSVISILQMLIIYTPPVASCGECVYENDKIYFHLKRVLATITFS